MDHWLSIEVFDGEFPASSWRRAHGDNLTEAAITNGALRWEWHEHQWGVVIELDFSDGLERDRFRELPAVSAARGGGRRRQSASGGVVANAS